CSTHPATSQHLNFGGCVKTNPASTRRSTSSCSLATTSPCALPANARQLCRVSPKVCSGISSLTLFQTHSSNITILIVHLSPLSFPPSACRVTLPRKPPTHWALRRASP